MTPKSKVKAKRKKSKRKLWAWYYARSGHYRVGTQNPMDFMPDLVKSMRLKVYELTQIN